MAKSKKDGNEPLVIKKYANRRLYNTAEGCFVTLADLHELVKQEISFVVLDVKSGKDLTSSVLAQIVAEEENKGNNMFSPDYLRQILKLYGDGTPPELASYLDQSISYFAENQDQMAKQFNDMLAGGDINVDNSMEKWAEIGQQNMALFQKSMAAFSGTTAEEETAPPPEPTNKDAETEIEKLRREMAEMQARLNGFAEDN
jgi:polyhydroxyalkanoate synthesis repressor PhaR